MVAPLEYSSSILREAGQARFDDFLSDVVAPAPDSPAAQAARDDMYTALMYREDDVLQAINKAANSSTTRAADDTFAGMSIRQAAVGMLDCLRVTALEVFSGRAHTALAMAYIDANTRIFLGLWVIVVALMAWAFAF